MSGFKVGDKVRIVGHVWEPEHGRDGVVRYSPNDGTYLVVRKKEEDVEGYWYAEDDLELIEEENEMKLWQNMTPEEKGALLLAHYEGKIIEFNDGYGWAPVSKPSWRNTLTYRVKPEPVVEVQRLFGWFNGHFNSTCFYANRYSDATHKITFNVVDGEPDVTSVKMEKL